MATLKPSRPLQFEGQNLYPLTTYDQIIMPDGKKWNGITGGSDVVIESTITLNGTETTSANFYAPTTAGANGQVLKSNGSGEPSWEALDYEDVGAAPAGYGLGQTIPRRVNSLDEITASGYYTTWFDTANGDPMTGNAVFTAITDERYNNVHIQSKLGGGYIHRDKWDNVWQPWEWVNPPMVSGVEYRTTERIGNKVVYKKSIDDVIHYRLDDETEWKPYSNAVGAAPAELVSESSWCDTYAQFWTKIETVYASMANSTRRMLSIGLGAAGDIPKGSWFVDIVRFYENYGYVEISNDAERYIRRLTVTWGSWIDYDPSAFAPAGYGWGSDLPCFEYQSADDANKTSVFYATQGTPTPGYGTWLCEFYSTGSGGAYGHMVATCQDDGKQGCVCTRLKVDNVWQSWEWENPPMTPGVEYRTTERIDGKAVYKKNVDGVTHYHLDGETEWKPYSNAVGAAPYSLIDYTPYGGRKNFVSNLLLIDLQNRDGFCNQSSVIATEDASTLINSPITSGAFYAYREVMFIDNPTGGLPKCVVRLTQAYPHGGDIWVNVYDPNFGYWIGWENFKSSNNFAPAGYGLGGGSVLKDTETWEDTGFFRTSTGTPNGGQIFGYQVDLYGNGMYRELYGTDISNTHRSRLHRTDINGTAGPWEWENPPMVLGTEYRTTERVDGKAVYKKNIDGMIHYRLDGEAEYKPLKESLSVNSLYDAKYCTTTEEVDGLIEADILKYSIVKDSATSLNNDGVLLTMGMTSSMWGAQLWLDDGSGAASMAIRNKNANGWNSWAKVLTENNWTEYAAPKSHSHTRLVADYITSVPTTLSDPGEMHYHYSVPSSAEGIFPTQNNANGILTLNTHGGDYYHQLGFSSNGMLYHRSTVASSLSSSVAWKVLLTESNWSNYINVSGLLSTITPSSIGAAPASHKHDYLSGWTDTRDTTTTPNDYNNTLRVAGIKTPTGSGISSSNGGSYSTLVGIRGWSDSSGGDTHELAFCGNGNLYHRHGSTTTWNAWKQIWVEGDSITGAVWNDYAEYRESDCAEFGRVLAENGDDTLSATTERLQHFAGISSDTWGFCQGETEKAKTPIAVAGRVLAYTYRNRNEYKSGDCVCAAPNGTVDIMTREEIEKYPDRIVGTVSCVPEYEEWGQGDRPAVKVDGRIWIKVK